VNWDATAGQRQFLQADPAHLNEGRQYDSLIGERALVPRQQLLIRNRFDEDGVTRAIVENRNTGPSSGAEAIARETDSKGIVVGLFGSDQTKVDDKEPGTAFVSALPDAEQLAFNHEGNGPLTFHTKSWHERMRLSEDGNVGIGTQAPAARLDVQRDWDDEQGDVQLLGDKPAIRFTGAESWVLQLGANDPGTLEFLHRTGAAQWETMLDLQADGRVDVPGALGFRQADLYLSGKNAWSSITYNARHGALGATGWIFPDPARNAVTIEMDDAPGFGRFEVWGTTNANKQAWTRRLAINTNSGDVYMADFGGNVGIGTSTPDQKLEVDGNVHVTGDLDVGGNILKGGNGALTVLTQQFAVKNGGGNTPGTWTFNHTGQLTERLGAFVMLNGFSVFDSFEGSPDWENKGFPHNLTSIAQVVYARITDLTDPDRVRGVAYTSESAGVEADNATLFTVVVIGRK
jgi:hypothetical protein